MEYVWYASYGSNLHHDRFLCYIEGGTPEGSEKTEIGCTDPTNPVKSEKEMLPYPLYFAKQSQRWQNEGVAFIGTKPIANTETYSRKYLITKEQFLEVVQQENNGIDVSLDLKQVMANGSHTFDLLHGTEWLCIQACLTAIRCLLSHHQLLLNLNIAHRLYPISR
ncbi:hypothetical protein [Geomicrobium sp. JCM 19039]|uniref:hypothetical protein n=1 Tax=Geomicrobium sp. JCM 19039 TaxID=1460636 RepID=UPI00045F27E0|nr:hypothetical protein [Geomicrobium sp. JCM 19039]GAK12751.1 hypothetical protein JCM19039_2549 [Geomicrobium sp. JCM 19039]